MDSVMPKKLAELLQEQQEPFVLEVYLLERGHHIQKNRFHSSEGGSCNSSTMAKPSLKRSVSWGLKGNRKFIPNCSKVVRALFTKLLTVHNNQKLENSQIRHQNSSMPDIEKGRQEIADEDKFSSASSTTMFNSCSESDVEDAHYSSKNADKLLAADDQGSSEVEYVLTENEVFAGWKFRWRGAEDSKQLSPVSVLEEAESYSGSPVGTKIAEHEAVTKQKQIMKSVSKCKSEKPIYKRTQEVQDFVGSNSSASSHYSINKKAVQQTKQLLFDCIREVMEKQKKESGGQQLQRIFGAEQLWELTCENLCVWNNESINETNITHLLHSDVLVSVQERRDLEEQTQVISFQLGDAILEDICNEIIMEMIFSAEINDHRDCINSLLY